MKLSQSKKTIPYCYGIFLLGKIRHFEDKSTKKLLPKKLYTQKITGKSDFKQIL